MTQYLACAFKEDGLTYTYHNDGDPVVVGDRVRVQSGAVEKKVTVVSIVEEKPKFPTKPILGKFVEEEKKEDANG